MIKMCGYINYDKNLKKFNSIQILTGHSSEIECGNFELSFNNTIQCKETYF